MQYTLAEAIEELKGNNLVYTDGDLTAKINKAIRGLARMKGWQCLRKVLRLSSAGPRFTLPQGYAGLVRVCVNGRPTTVRGQDFRFVQSGPGDTLAADALRHGAPRGFSFARNVIDDGKAPVMVEPYGPFRVFAYRDDKPGEGQVCGTTLSFTGTDLGGRSVRFENIDLHDHPVYDPSDGHLVSGDPIESASTVVADLVSVDSVIIGEHAEEGKESVPTHIVLFAEDLSNGLRYPIALYKPGVKAPYFHRYLLPDIRPGQPVELLVEARLDPLPLTKGTDVLPFETIEPIEWMIRSDWEMRSGEVAKGESYRNNAANWLLAQEVADDTVQTSFIINTPFAGSPGEISIEADNI